MSFFSSLIDAKLDGRSIGCVRLVHADFLDAPQRWFSGVGVFEGGGHTWRGTGDFISVEGLDQPFGMDATAATFTLTGIDPTLVTLVRQASSRVRDRDITTYLQFFDLNPASGGPASWAPIGDPVGEWAGIMGQMTYLASGPTSRVISLAAENVWTSIRKPPHGYYTPADQRGLFPTDKGLDFIPALVDKTVLWPVF